MTHGAVLVLNRLYQAVQITSIRRAFILFYSGRAKAVDQDFSTHAFDSWRELPSGDTDRCLGTAHGPIRVPDVIQLLRYDKLGLRDVRFNRKNLLTRDRFSCQYCKKSLPSRYLNLDHVVPRSRGGKTSWENVVCACIPCNSKKGNRTPEEANMKLLRPPKRPVGNPLMRSGFLGPLRQEWKTYLSETYWNVEFEESLSAE